MAYLDDWDMGTIPEHLLIRDRPTRSQRYRTVNDILYSLRESGMTNCHSMLAEELNRLEERYPMFDYLELGWDNEAAHHKVGVVKEWVALERAHIPLFCGECRRGPVNVLSRDRFWCPRCNQPVPSPHGPEVKTPVFHAGDEGSIPSGDATK